MLAGKDCCTDCSILFLFCGPRVPQYFLLVVHYKYHIENYIVFNFNYLFGGIMYDVSKRKMKKNYCCLKKVGAVYKLLK